MTSGYTATEWVTLMGAAGILVGLIVTGIVSIITALKVAKIEAHVNSQKTAMEEQAKARMRENDLLREMLEDRKQQAALLAQAVATRLRAADTPAAIGVVAPLPVTVVNTPDAPVPTEVVNPPDAPVPTVIKEP